MCLGFVATSCGFGKSNSPQFWGFLLHAPSSSGINPCVSAFLQPDSNQYTLSLNQIASFPPVPTPPPPFMNDNFSFYRIEFYILLVRKHDICSLACHPASGPSTVLHEVIMTGSCVFVAWLHEACHI